MGYDLINIKKYYGESMMHLCRELFPTILEQEGLLFSLLDSKFARSKFLGEDIIKNGEVNDFKNYILSLLNISKEETETTKTPKELLEEAGYILYQCKTKNDIQKFKKYYSDDEELCTFRGDRLKECHVFFAVKKNVDKIKRKDFLKPRRQDEYGTSVISIQFSSGISNTLSIKNRYNHTVPNPDATFSNNLDNIISGLTKSFEKEYNLSIVNNHHNNFELSDYVLANDGKYYKYTMEINNVYYCPDNIIIDNFSVIDDYTEKEKYIIMDYFIIDLVNKKIILYDKTINDSFLDATKDIKKIEVTNVKDTKHKKIKLIFEDDTCALLELNKTNNIISYENENLIEIGNNFLIHGEFLKDIYIPNVTKIGDDFLYYNTDLKSISLQNVESIGNEFLKHNENLEEIFMPKVREIGNDFLYYNKSVRKIDFPFIRRIGNRFLVNNERLEEINIPEILKIGDQFLTCNNIITKIDFPLLKEVGSYFYSNNELIKEVKLPNLIVIGSNFLSSNKKLTKLNLPNVKVIGNDFMIANNILAEINLMNVIKIGSSFLYGNNTLTSLNLPKVECISSAFLYRNVILNKLEVPVLKSVESRFLDNNRKLKCLKLPMIQQIGDKFLGENEKLNYFYAPELISVGNYFLWSNLELNELDLPSLMYVGNDFVSGNEKLKYINLPKLEIAGNYFLQSNTMLTKQGIPDIMYRGNYFIKYNNQEKEKIKVLKF